MTPEYHYHVLLISYENPSRVKFPAKRKATKNPSYGSKTPTCHCPYLWLWREKRFDENRA